MANPMSLNRAEERFLQCHDSLNEAVAVGDKVGANIARAEIEQFQGMIGEDRARELLG